VRHVFANGKNPYFLMVIAGKAGNHHQKEMLLGGLQALQTSQQASTA